MSKKQIDLIYLTMLARNDYIQDCSIGFRRLFLSARSNEHSFVDLFNAEKEIKKWIKNN